MAGLSKIVEEFLSSNDENSLKVSVATKGSPGAADKMQDSGFTSDGWPSFNAGFGGDSSTYLTSTPRRVPKDRARPPTPSLVKKSSEDVAVDKTINNWATSEFVEWSNMPMDETPSRSNMTIDVKPLPKLRLDLMPAPREEDEDDISSKY